MHHSVPSATRCVPRGVRRSGTFIAATVAILATISSAPAQEPDGGVAPPATMQADAASLPSSAQVEAPSEAERIARLQRSIDETRQLLDELRARILDPNSEFARAEAEFTAVDALRDVKRRELAELRALADTDARELSKRESELADIATQHALLRERFDLAIQERKAQQEQAAALDEKLKRDAETLDRLRGVPATQPARSTTAPAAETPVAEPSKTAETPPPSGDAAKEAVPADEKRPSSLITVAPTDEEFTAAAEAAERARAEVEAARSEAGTITERLAALQKAIDLERQLLATGQQRADNARATESTLGDALVRRTEERAEPQVLRQLRQQIADARKRFEELIAENRQRTERIQRLQEELADVQREHIAALRRVEETGREAQTAQQRVEALRNPFAPRNVLQWLLDRGPRVLATIFGVLLLLWLTRLLENRMVRAIARATERGDTEDRENRAKTLLQVFHSAASVTIIGGGAMMLLTQIGVDIVPLLGGAAVLGLAVAFGAQNLIRDYFYGFMILLENQYVINDVVKIGPHSGQVERITLRVTVLRALDGSVHFIPNGQITSVINLTHGWSRALFDIPVGVFEDVDRIMALLLEIGNEMRVDPHYRGLILESPQMLGVESLEENSVVIRFYMKTRPLKQWIVRREMLRRIKLRFEALGIDLVKTRKTAAESPPAGSLTGEAPPVGDADERGFIK